VAKRNNKSKKYSSEEKVDFYKARYLRMHCNKTENKSTFDKYERSTKTKTGDQEARLWKTHLKRHDVKRQPFTDQNRKHVSLQRKHKNRQLKTFQRVRHVF